MTNNITSVPVHHTNVNVFGINVYRNLGGFGEILCTFNFRSAATEDGLAKAISKLLRKKYDIILNENNHIVNDGKLNPLILSIAGNEKLAVIFDKSNLSCSILKLN